MRPSKLTSERCSSRSQWQLRTSLRNRDSYKAVSAESARYAVGSFARSKRPARLPVGGNTNPINRTLPLRALVRCMRFQVWWAGVSIIGGSRSLKFMGKVSAPQPLPVPICARALCPAPVLHGAFGHPAQWWVTPKTTATASHR